jgi:hypothetical protein
MMKISLILIAIVGLSLVACSVPEEPNTDALVQTALANLQATNLAGQITQESVPLVTTPEPQAETQTPITIVGSDIFALNYLDSQDRGGIVIDIGRVLVGSKEAINSYLGGDFSEISGFEDKPVIVEIIFKVINNTDQVISVYPDQGTIIIGSEQISMLDYFMNSVGEDISGDIFPGVTMIGGLYFGVSRSTVEEITQMTISIDGPFNQDFDRWVKIIYSPLICRTTFFKRYPKS